MGRMYRENRKSVNAQVGCQFDCVYCKPSFQAQMKRQRKRCRLCYDYTPHFHPERLEKAPPRTKEDEFIFFPSSGDPYWAKEADFQQMLDYAAKYRNRTFLTQSKAPAMFQYWKIPDNVIVGTTIETDWEIFYHNPSKYQSYFHISAAPYPKERAEAMYDVKHERKSVTIEPVLDFNLLQLIHWMKEISPDIIYVGYDNHNCKLPEPKLAKTLQLIDDLREYTKADVRVKSLRKAWWEE